jgi:peptidoglycan-associated lipoprotein
MRMRYAAYTAAALLLGACGSTSDTATSASGGTAAGEGANGAAGAGGISSSALGGYGAGGAMAGSQDDLETNVGDRVYFGFDTSSLDSTARQTLDRQGDWMQQFPNVQVMVEGHTDERGTTEYNLALGERRASEVKNYLTALGVSPSRILTISYGEERPADPGHDESAYALNRRAVTVVNVTN